MISPTSLLSNIFSSLCILVLGFFVILLTLQTTIMQRENIKDWLVKGKAYENIAAYTYEQQGSGDPGVVARPTANSAFEKPVKDALAKTFNPAYAKKNTEYALDKTYDWLEGKTASPSFTIRVDAEQQTFIKNLVPELRKQLRKLPPCQTAQPVDFTDLQCRPVGVNDQTTAQALAAASVQQTDLFDQPLTNKTIGDDGQPLALTINLPALYQAIPGLTSTLLVVTLAMASLAILVSRERISAGRRLLLQAIISMGIAFACGLGLAAIGTFLDMQIEAFFTTVASVTNALLAPLTDQALPAIGGRIMLISGAIVVICILLRLGIRMREQAQSREPAAATPSDRW